METLDRRPGFFAEPIAIAFLLAGARILLYLFAAGSYGYFRDELYFLACTEHLAWGYPDHAPLSVFLAKFSRDLFGDSLYAIRLLPALAGALKILLTGLLVREFGGRYLSILLACLSVLFAPFFLGIDNLLSMNAYEPIFWIGCALAYIWAVKREDPRYWLLFGASAGLGVMNKHSMVFFGVAFLIGLILTRDRKYFRTKYFWFAGGIALLLIIPNLIWQYENNWATLELLQNVQKTGKNVVLSPLDFVLQQMLIMLPFTAPIWIGGLWYLLFDRNGRRFRTLGIAYLAVLAIMIGLKAKNYYLAPVYPILFAAGGVFWEALAAKFRVARFGGYAYAAVIIVTGVAFVPLALPVLPVEMYVPYQTALGVNPPKTEVGHQGPLPQHFGDMFGWEEMVAKTAQVYNSLDGEERRRTAIYGSNYGEAGAIDHFGPAYGLPKAISGHQSYYLWGPRNYDGRTIIILGGDREDAEESCGRVEQRDPVRHPYAMGEEQFDILICRDLRTPLSELWPKLKNWN